ncbi:DUF6973 domain-containing protein [Aquimarina sp. 2-A2]|uniref:DUF6973 domain-containing protein n=1 Tax=Aquimarina sp. 2-A2 TaxID=3382644 RepID=UPI00387F324D
MTAWELIRRFDLNQLVRLAWLMMRHPLYVFPTLKATQETLRICNKRYGDLHHKNGKANAFRHALWNLLLCRYVYQKSKNTEKAEGWAERVTDLHERLAPNEELDTAMDLHNNKIGRMLFAGHPMQTRTDAIESLQRMTQEAKPVSDAKNIVNFEGELVYIAS